MRTVQIFSVFVSASVVLLAATSWKRRRDQVKELEWSHKYMHEVSTGARPDPRRPFSRWLLAAAVLAGSWLLTVAVEWASSSSAEP